VGARLADCKGGDWGDPVAVPSFSWQILTKPTGSKATLILQNTLTPKVWFDMAGQYVLRFTACPFNCRVGTAIVGPQTKDLPFQPYSDLTPKRLRFRLERFEIDKTMALHEDSDLVFLLAKVGGEIVSQKHDKVGDLNDGVYSLGWDLDTVTVDPAHFVVFSYAIVNAGHGNAAQATAAAKSIADYLQAGGDVGGISSAGILKAVGFALDLIFPNCDGVVLTDNVVIYPTDYSGHWPPDGSVRVHASDLAGRAVLEWTHSYAGPDTPWGCGSNAQYKVTYSITPDWDPQPPPPGPFGPQ
jgi:hypothetical protein